MSTATSPAATRSTPATRPARTRTSCSARAWHRPAAWNYARTHQVTMLMTLHNVAALVLRPPGLHDGGLSPDEDRMKQIGDAMGSATGYTSQYSWQLYDTAGTTEDDTYAATGGYGYT